MNQSEELGYLQRTNVNPSTLRSWLLAALACLFMSDSQALLVTEFHEVDLGAHTQFIFDKQDTLSIEQIRSADTELDWQITPTQRLNFGMQTETIWLKNQMRFTEDFPAPWLININYPPLDHLTLYIILNGQLLDTISMGDSLNFDQRPLLSKNYLYRMQFNQGDHLELYVKVKSSGNLLIPLKITPVNEYLEEANKQNTLTSAIYGILLVMGLYNLLISLIVRDSNYVIYVFWVFSSLVFIFTLNGDGFQLLWPEAPELNNYILPIALSVAGFTNTLFVLKFLKIDSTRKKLAKVFYFVLSMYTLSFLVSWGGDYSTSIKLALTVNSFALLLVTLSTLYLVIKRQPGSIIFLFSFSVLIASAIILSLGTANIIPKTVFTIYANQLAQALETVIFSLALAQKIETERKLRILKEREAEEFSEQAKENLAQYSALFNNSPLGIFRFKQTGEIQTYNPAFKALFEERSETNSLIGLLYSDKVQLDSSLFRLSRSNGVYEEEIQLSSNSGGMRWLSLTLVAVNLAQEQLYEGQLKDITQEKLAEIESEHQEKQKADMLSRLVSGVAHEINTPIGTNITALSLLDEERKTLTALYEDSKMTRDNLSAFLGTCDSVSSIITLNQQRISALVEKFKDVSVNRLSMTESEFDLVNLIRQVSESYCTSKCVLTLDMPNHLKVLSFEQAFTEIIIQLISNSIKYSDKDKVEISIALTTKNNLTTFTYRDNGPGIDSSTKKNHAFEPFYTSRPGDPECTGLGMFVIYNLCKQLLHTNPMILDENGFGLYFSLKPDTVI